jgi:hypothetical protein
MASAIVDAHLWSHAAEPAAASGATTIDTTGNTTLTAA